MPGATMAAVSSVRGRPLQSTRSSSIPASAPATASACATPFVVQRDLARVDGRPSSREVRHLAVAHEVEAAAHRRRIARCWRATSSRRRTPTASTKPPLLVLDRVRAFLDEHGLGSGEVRARRIGEGGGSNFTFLLERDDRRVRAAATAATAAAAVGARRRARGAAPARAARGRVLAAADDRRGLRGREHARRPLLRHDVPRRVRPDRRAAAGARDRGCASRARRRSRRRARRDPRGRRDDSRTRRVRSAGELQRAPGPALHAALGDQQDA